MSSADVEGLIAWLVIGEPETDVGVASGLADVGVVIMFIEEDRETLGRVGDDAPDEVPCVIGVVDVAMDMPGGSICGAVFALRFRSTTASAAGAAAGVAVSFVAASVDDPFTSDAPEGSFAALSDLDFFGLAVASAPSAAAAPFSDEDDAAALFVDVRFLGLPTDAEVAAAASSGADGTASAAVAAGVAAMPVSEEEEDEEEPAPLDPRLRKPFCQLGVLLKLSEAAATCPTKPWHSPLSVSGVTLARTVIVSPLRNMSSLLDWATWSTTATASSRLSVLASRCV